MTQRKEKVVPDYLQVIPDPKEDFYFDESRPHLSINHQILNSTRTVLYVRDLGGVISKVPPRPLVSDRGNVVAVNTTYTSFTSKIKETVSKRRYKITPSRVSKGRAVYVRELGLYFSVDEAFLKNLPVYQEDDQEDIKTSFISTILKNLQQCPIRIIINDPTEEMKNVYGIIDNRVYRIPIISSPKLGGTCIIQFASKLDDEAEQIFEFDIDELKEMFKQHGCMSPAIGGYNLLLYPSLLDAEEYINTILKEQDKRTITVASQEKEQLKRTYENRISHLELVIKDKDQEIQGLKRILELSDLKAKRDFANRELEYNEQSKLTTLEQQQLAKLHQLNLQDKQIAREDARARKSEMDVKSSELGMTTTALKTVTTVAPLVISAAGLYFVWAGGSAAIMGIAIAKLLSNATASISAVGNILRTGITWFVRLFW